VTFFAGVSWYVQQSADGPRTVDPEFARILIYAWIALTAFTLFSALFFWRTRVDPMIHGTESLPRERLTQLSANLMICWALIESGSLFGVTVYFITGTTWVAAVAVILIWAAFLATRPQMDWYQRFR
jgi:hypothetical protein